MEESAIQDLIVLGLLVTDYKPDCSVCHRLIAANDFKIVERTQLIGGNYRYDLRYHCPNCPNEAGMVVEYEPDESEETVEASTPLPSWVPKDLFNEPA